VQHQQVVWYNRRNIIMKERMKERENLRNHDHGSGLTGIVDGIRGVFRRKAQIGSEETFRTIAEQSPNMIFINCMGRVVYANERCKDVMGYSKAEFYSMDFDFLTLIAPESRELVSANFRRHMSGEALAPYEYVLITKDNTRIDVIITTKMMSYEGERALLGIITDISDRKRAEAEIRRRLEFEKAVAAISSRFVGISDTDQAIDKSLGEMGRVCGTDRVYTFHFNSDLTVMENTHEWCGEGVEPQIENLQNLSTESFPWWMASLEIPQRERCYVRVPRLHTRRAYGEESREPSGG